MSFFYIYIGIYLLQSAEPRIYSSQGIYMGPAIIRINTVYKEICSSTIGEHLLYEREMLNSTDRYAVAVLKDNVNISHLPRALSQICSLFTARGGAITCVVNGAQKYLVDLRQGGLKAPCKLQFFSSRKIATCSYNSNKFHMKNVLI